MYKMCTVHAYAHRGKLNFENVKTRLEIWLRINLHYTAVYMNLPTCILHY